MADVNALLRAGLTYRQADHWTRRGYLRPTNPDCGSGHGRDYPASEVRVAGVMVRLVAAGLTVEAAHTVARGESQLAPGVRVVMEAA